MKPIHPCPNRFAILLLAAGLAAWPWESVRAEGEIDFERVVGPVLARRCVACHNASDRKGGLDLTERESALAGGDSGRVIEPGRPDDSLLWQYISSGEMPPKKPLAEAEQVVLRDWIRSGAPWSGAAIDPYQFTSDVRAGYDWWSLQPVVSPSLPAGNDEGWAVNPIDRFVIAKLSPAKLSPSSPADRRTLIRRLYCDLLGFLPTPDEVTSFQADETPFAYERLVDRVMSSPHYGERWARHWLDVVRYGESQGFERDKIRPNSWRYRDWVIDALNSDLSYQEFVKLQIAGDVMRPDDPQAIVATGFLVAGPYDEVGQTQQSAAMRAVVREDELEDIVSTVGQTFLGLTVNCGRCHDHKFDPVRQREYYRMCAALAGVRHGDRDLPASAAAAQAALAVEQFAARRRLLEKRLDAIESPIRERLLMERKQRLAAIVLPGSIASWEFNDDFRDSVGQLHGEARDGAKLDGGELVLDGKGFVSTAPLTTELREKTIEAWLSLADLKQQGGGVVSVQSLDGETFDAIVFGERDARQWMAGSNFYARTQSFQGPEEREAAKQTVHLAIAYRRDGTIAAYRNGQPYGNAYKSSGPLTFLAGQSQVVFGLRHSPPGGNKLLRGRIDRARLYDRALTDDEIAASAGAGYITLGEKELVAALSDRQRTEREILRFEIDYVREQISRVHETKAYAVLPAPTVPATHLLLRGNPAQKRDEVSPGGIASLRGLDAEFGLGHESTDADRRGCLAQWIAHERNPLFARVLVNRLWHYHFGLGLVDTPNDFGFNGGRPSHPELLDWLAHELVRSGWSIKHLQRLIVTSATYRQSSVFRDAAAKVDADNRLVWRKAPWRLEAESLRDIMLMLAGELDMVIHGPGYYDFVTFTSNSQFYEMRDPIGTSFQRRSIYRTWLRSGRSPLLDVFDCPDPSTKTPHRAVTTTPLQALSLLNNSFVLRMAERFATRVKAEAGEDVQGQVRRVFEHAYGRPPDSAEQPPCEKLVRDHGLATLCRVVFNSNELLYVD